MASVAKLKKSEQDIAPFTTDEYIEKVKRENPELFEKFSEFDKQIEAAKNQRSGKK